MINTYNESSLHKTLKHIYSLENGDKTESQIDNWICDIVKKDGEIIEIQTASLSKLEKKVKDLTTKQYKLTLVYPLVIEKYIETYNQEGLISKRKSPKKQNIYSIFRELTKLYPYLDNKYFTLQVLFISITEERIKTDSPTQSQNQKRRYLKNWLKTGKRLNKIIEKETFYTKDDYIKLIPTERNKIFTIPEIKKLLPNNIKESEIRIFIWILLKAGFIEKVEKSRPIKYKIKKSSS